MSDRLIALLATIVVLMVAVIVSGCIKEERFVFVEYHIDKYYNASMDSGLPPMPLIDPLYRYDAENRTLNPLLQQEIKNRNFELLLGHRVTAHGFPIQGESSQLAPAQVMPYEYRYPGTPDLKIDSFAIDGTVRLTYAGQDIALKPGETWSTWRESTETLNGFNGSVMVNVAINDSITNYGFLSRSDMK